MRSPEKVVLIVILVSLVSLACAQPKTRKLPAPINHSSKNAFAPFMSLDGTILLMSSDYTEDDNLGVFYSSRETGSWSEPAELPRSMTLTALAKSYTISPDGKNMYLTTSAFRGLGGFDIVNTHKTSSGWAQHDNIGKPINSTLHEGSPTFTPDGKTIYFMRCKTMDTRKADGCSIYTAQYSGNQWSEPQLLPDFVNTGNSQLPRILADSETLIYSSNKIPGSKGGFDLYMTRVAYGTWSAPVPLDFVNTPRDDQHVSINGIGAYLTRDQPGKGVSEIIEYSIPPDLAPHPMQRVSGQVLSGGKPAQAFISVTQTSNPERRVQVAPDSDGKYFVYLKGGNSYELAFEPARDELLYYTKRIDLREQGFQPLEKLDVTLEPLRANTSFFLDNVFFEPHSDRLAEPFDAEMRRLARVIQSTQELKFDIRVHLNTYREDSVKGDPDLTEVRVDSTWIHIVMQASHVGQPDSARTDNLIAADSTARIDSLAVAIDSLTTYEYDTLVLRSTYHNDRTLRQARAISEVLLQKGVPPEQLAWEGKRGAGDDPSLPAIRVEVAILPKD